MTPVSQELQQALLHNQCISDLSGAYQWLAQLQQYAEIAFHGWERTPHTWATICDVIASAMARSRTSLSPSEWVQTCHLQDLALATFCLVHDEYAMQLFRTNYEQVLWGIVTRFASPALPAEELYQELWIRLFVAQGNRIPKLSSYAAQGPLLGWLRVTSVRTCIDVMRSHQHLKLEQVTDREQLAQMPQEALDIELEFLKSEYRAHFRTAFEAAIQTLSGHDRLLLRYHVVEQLNIDQIGTLMQCHRSTAARHLQQARQHLLKATEQQLMHRLSIPKDEFQSIIQLIQSRWEVSLQRLLQAS